MAQKKNVSKGVYIRGPFLSRRFLNCFSATKDKHFRFHGILSVILCCLLLILSAAETHAGTWRQLSSQLNVGVKDLDVAVVGGKIYAFDGTQPYGSGCCSAPTGKVEVYDPLLNIWTMGETTMPTARYGYSTAVMDDKIYVMGGEGTARVVEMYDPATGIWETRNQLLNGHNFGAAEVVNGRIYMLGGWTSAVEEYNPDTDTWTAKTSIPPSSGPTGVASAVYNGKIYLFGGWAYSNTMFDGVSIYDPATDTWDTGTPLPVPTTNGVAAVLCNKIYYMGGEVSPPFYWETSAVHVYDPQTDTWSSGPAMPTVRTRGAVTVLNNAIYVIGGDTNEDWDPPVATVVRYSEMESWEQKTSIPEYSDWRSACASNGLIYSVGGYVSGAYAAQDLLQIYDPVMNAWDMGLTMINPRYGLGCSTVDGRIYAIGGMSVETVGQQRVYQPVNIVECYSPIAHSWIEMDSALTYPIAYFATVELNGKIYTLGGYEALQGVAKVVDYLLEYDPVADIWSVKAPMPTARMRLAAAVVDGKIYAMGGNNLITYIGDNEIPAVDFDTVEVYDPATNTWDIASPMPVARHGMAGATVGGRIYTFGGSQLDGSNYLDIVEEYDPSTDQWTNCLGGCEPMPFGDDNLAAVTMNDQIHVIGRTPHWGFTPPHMVAGLIVDDNHDGDIDGLDLAAFAEQLDSGTHLVGLAFFAEKFGRLISGCAEPIPGI